MLVLLVKGLMGVIVTDCASVTLQSSKRSSLSFNQEFVLLARAGYVRFLVG